MPPDYPGELFRLTSTWSKRSVRRQTLLPAIRTMQANGFTVGLRANARATTYHYVAWKAVAGRTAVGTYFGNGADPRQFTGASTAMMKPRPVLSAW
mgnify:CR=1 FL=1